MGKWSLISNPRHTSRNFFQKTILFFIPRRERWQILSDFDDNQSSLSKTKKMERTKVCVRAPDIKHFLIKQPSSKNHSLWSQTFWWEEIFRPNIELWFFLNIQISINPGKSFIFLQSNVIIPRRGCRYFGKEQHQAVFYLGEPFKRPTLLAALFRGP